MQTSTRYCATSLIFILIIAIQSATQANAADLTQPIIRYDTIHRDIEGYYGMAVSQNHLATQVGHDVLARGGNAVDAAVAMGFALAVTLPRAGNIGGSGFMLVYLAEKGETIALDYRAMAPISRPESNNRTELGEIHWDKLTFGPNASGVPGTVAGLHEAWKQYGTLPWKDLLQPAIDLAEDGIVVWPDLHFVLTKAKQVLSHFPATKKVYLRPDGEPWQPGELLVQKDLAWSLTQIQQQGADAFYKGALAERIVAAFAEHESHFTADDLAAYQVKYREPVSTDYRGFKVTSMPPSSAGGITLLQMLNMLERYDVKSLQAGSADQLHLLAEVMKRAAANRRTYVGDPDFVDIAINGYLSKALAAKMIESIDPDKASVVKDIKPAPIADYESRDTTHYSVMDAHGNAVSNTYTLGYSFGSGFVADGTGILFDNQLRNFYVSRGYDGPNAYQPGKRMISTMTPTIVFDNNKPFLVTGTPGGSRIINAVLQVIVNVIDFDMSIADATHHPRIHQGWNSQTLHYEPGISPDTLAILKQKGHSIRAQQSMASTQSILFSEGKYLGSADPRRPNAKAMGLITPPSKTSTDQ